MADPKRGEVWQVDLGLVGKVRPALVLNVEIEDHERALYIIIPHTTSLRGTRFEVAVSLPGLKSGAFDVQQIIAIPKAKLLRKRTVLNEAQLDSIEEAIALLLGLPTL